MNPNYEFDPTTGELKLKQRDSGITNSEANQHSTNPEITFMTPQESLPSIIQRTPSYIERVLSDTLRISIHRVTNSGIYKFAEQSFSFSRKFTITKTVGTSLMAQGAFGIILMILLIPLALVLDITILIGGITLGSILFLLIFLAFIIVLIFLIVKSLFNL